MVQYFQNLSAASHALYTHAQAKMFARLYTSSSYSKNSIISSSFYIALNTTVRITHLFRTSAQNPKKSALMHLWVLLDLFSIHLVWLRQLWTGLEQLHYFQP